VDVVLSSPSTVPPWKTFTGTGKVLENAARGTKIVELSTIEPPSGCMKPDGRMDFRAGCRSSGSTPALNLES
jgi:hypothetical protein